MLSTREGKNHTKNLIGQVKHQFVSVKIKEEIMEETEASLDSWWRLTIAVKNSSQTGSILTWKKDAENRGIVYVFHPLVRQ